MFSVLRLSFLACFHSMLGSGGGSGDDGGSRNATVHVTAAVQEIRSECGCGCNCTCVFVCACACMRVRACTYTGHSLAAFPVQLVRLWSALTARDLVARVAAICTPL